MVGSWLKTIPLIEVLLGFLGKSTVLLLATANELSQWKAVGQLLVLVTFLGHTERNTFMKPDGPTNVFQFQDMFHLPSSIIIKP